MGTHSAPAWKACRWNHSEHPRRRQRCGRALCSRDVFAVKPSSSGAGCRWLFLRSRGAGGDYSAQRSAAPRERRGSARGNAEARPAVQGDQDEVGPPRPQSARRRRGGPQGAPPGPAGATLSLGPGKLPDDALLFPAPLSEAPLSPRNFSKRWEDAAAAIGLAGVTFHALRHTHASQLIDAGIDVVKISKRLGHASPNRSMRTCSSGGRTRPPTPSTPSSMRRWRVAMPRDNRSGGSRVAMFAFVPPRTLPKHLISFDWMGGRAV